MFLYQKIEIFFAQIADGFTEIASAELASLGANDIKPVYRGIHFRADHETLYKINLQSRLCSRICAALINFDCHSTKYLYKTAKKLPWNEILNENKTFAINATVSNSRIKHSQYAALCLKDAIVDYFREKSGKRPSIDRRTPDLWLDLYIAGNKATISIDTSGGSLHRRGYRQDSVEAPMQETLAAAIIHLSEWDGSQPLIDPMCGSGTLLAEALMSYSKIPAAINRKYFGFEALPDFDPKLWSRTRKEALRNIRKLPAKLISGSDISKQAAETARTNLKLLEGGGSIKISATPFQEIKSLEDTTIICNPPYGVRLKKKNEAAEFIEEFGNFLKRRCTGSTAYIYLGQKELIKSVGLRPSWKKPLKSGGLDGVLAKYEMY